MAILTDTKQKSQGSHWYTLEGEACHQVPKAKGGELRNATVADARKMGLFPSVTNILSVIAKPGLDKWKLQQVAKAAYQAPPDGKESVEYFTDRIIEAAFDQVVDAADFGSRIHDALEKVFEGEPVEEEILPTCRELGIGFVPYSPLGRGFLTGTVTRAEDLPEGDYRRNDPRYQEDNYDANMRIVGVVKAVAERRGTSPAQVALAWLLAQGPDVVPIPGAKRRVTLEDSMAAAEVVLTADDVAEISAVAPVGATSGPRYRPAGMATVRL